MKTNLINITDSRFNEEACGNCFSVLFGDEIYCPCCGAEVILKAINMTEDEVIKRNEKYQK